MPRNRHDRTGVYLILASIAGALTLAVVGGGFWLAFRHPNESEAAKQARERREQDRAYYDSLGPYDVEKAAKRQRDKDELDALAAEFNSAKTTKARQAELLPIYEQKAEEFRRNYPGDIAP